MPPSLALQLHLLLRSARPLVQEYRAIITVGDADHGLGLQVDPEAGSVARVVVQGRLEDEYLLELCGKARQGAVGRDGEVECGPPAEQYIAC